LSSGGDVEYSRQVIRIHDRSDIQQILKIISGLQDLVVVNIASSAEMKPVLFSEENLRTILAGSPESLLLEGLPLAEYKRLVGEKIDQTVHSTLSLRAMLRTHFAAELVDEMREFVARLNEILPLLDCHALQNARSGVAENVQKLRDSLGQLTASCREHGDNVRCMDDLQYEILPPLKGLLKLFRK